MKWIAVWIMLLITIAFAGFMFLMVDSYQEHKAQEARVKLAIEKANAVTAIKACVERWETASLTSYQGNRPIGYCKKEADAAEKLGLDICSLSASGGDLAEGRCTYDILK